MLRRGIVLFSLVVTIAFLTGCGGSAGGPAGGPPPPPSAPQMVFTAPESSDSTEIVPATGPWDIVAMNLDGSGRRTLVSDGTQNFLPHFSPDGSKVVYTKFLMGGYSDPEESTIYVYDLASGQQTRLLNTTIAESAAWSPDGTQILFGVQDGSSLWIMNADGSNPHEIGVPSGLPNDQRWGDPAWSSDNWILFTVVEACGNTFNTRLDKMRPDGSSRTQVDDGGPNCTPPGAQQSGDADPGFSADGQTIFSSRGFPVPPADGPTGSIERKLYSLSSDAFFPGKPENDLSLPSEPSCIEGVPKGSPDGTRVLLFRWCFDNGAASQPGVYVTDTAGSYRTLVVTPGFGADWNPAAK